MPKIVPIVEGPGDVAAVPVLLYKILHEAGRYDIQVATPKDAHGRPNLLKRNGLETFIRRCWAEHGCGAVLVLLDADTECPVSLARGLSSRAATIGVRHPVMFAIAKCEYEAWFLASLGSIAGRDWQGRVGLPAATVHPGNADDRVGVKGWLDRQLPPGRAYKETVDQAILTRMIDLEMARQNSRSFRRLCHAVAEAVEAIDQGRKIVTP